MCWRNRHDDFLRLLADQRESSKACSRFARHSGPVPIPRAFQVAPASFRSVPGAPFAYWVSNTIREAFRELPAFQRNGRCARVGLQTSDDFRFVRGWWEIAYENNDLRWGFAKGGSFSPYYADVYLVTNWASDGKEMKAWADPLYGNSGWSRILKSTEYYVTPGSHLASSHKWS